MVSQPGLEAFLCAEVDAAAEQGSEFVFDGPYFVSEKNSTMMSRSESGRMSLRAAEPNTAISWIP
ncbi:MAG: hypothetical protein ABSB15_21885 [Bryobacteraceae bacterium]